MRKLLKRVGNFLAKLPPQRHNPLNRRVGERRSSRERRVFGTETSPDGNVSMSREEYLAHGPTDTSFELKGESDKSPSTHVEFKDRRVSLRGIHDVTYLEEHKQRRGTRPDKRVKKSRWFRKKKL